MRCRPAEAWVEALAAGNRVVAIPAPRHARAAGDLAQILATSDVPGGALNLLSGDPAELAPALASHDEVDALWLADPRLRKPAETAAAVPKKKAPEMRYTTTSRSVATAGS